MKYEKNYRSGKEEKWRWTLTELGEKTPLLANCDDTYREQRTNEIYCDGLFTLRMNKETLRFLYSYFYGYTDGVDNNANTPALAIGKCTPL